jgi:hypothetical protein
MLAYLLVAGLINWLATTVLVEGKIFEWLRNSVNGEYMAYLVRCHLCTGVWVGIAMAIAFTALGAPEPYTGWWLLLANALAFKAAGHMLLVVHKLGDAVINRIKEG